MSHPRHLFGIVVVLLVALSAWAQEQELTAADHTAIRTVIERQLEAFRQDDADAAFAFASPMIQAKFGTPEVFLNMVKTSYQPVYRPQYVAFRDLHVVQGVPTQPVFLIGADGVPVTAIYIMQKQPDGVWKIDGCYLKASKGEAL
jgi:ketosteroid isomerase-like protein